MAETVQRFLTGDELDALGFASLGRGVKIDRSALLIEPGRIQIGDQTRIDAFCLLSAAGGSIRIGRNVHIAAGAYLYGRGSITVADFAGISSRVVIYSSNDDYSGAAMTGPTLPERLTHVSIRPVSIGRHVVVGAGSIVLPGVTLRDGSAVGALSLIKRDVAEFALVAGNPVRVIGQRSRQVLELERQFIQSAEA